MTIKHATQINSTLYPDSPEKELGTDEWNAEHVINGEIEFQLPTSEVAVDVNNIGVFADKIAGRMMLSTITPDSQSSAIQPFLGRNKVSMATANPSSSTISNFGLNVTALGTAAGTAVQTLNLFYNMRRTMIIGSLNQTTSISGWRSNSNQFFLTNSGNMLGGFFYVCTFGIGGSTNTSSMSFFTGLSSNAGVSTTSAGSIDTLPNTVGVACDTEIYGSNFYFVVKSGSSAPAGSDQLNFLASSPLTDVMYQLIMFSAPGSGIVTLQLLDLDNQNIVGTWTASVDLPINTLLAPHGFVGANGLATNSAEYAFSSIYIETDY